MAVVALADGGGVIEPRAPLRSRQRCPHLLTAIHATHLWLPVGSGGTRRRFRRSKRGGEWTHTTETSRNVSSRKAPRAPVDGSAQEGPAAEGPSVRLPRSRVVKRRVQVARKPTARRGPRGTRLQPRGGAGGASARPVSRWRGSRSTRPGVRR